MTNEPLYPSTTASTPAQMSYKLKTKPHLLFCLNSLTLRLHGENSQALKLAGRAMQRKLLCNPTASFKAYM